MHWYSSSKSSPGHNQIGVYDDVKQIFKMAPTPRKTKNVTSRLFATPRSAFFPQYFESCDLRQWGISDVKKNGVRWTFVRSLELKRPKTRVFLLNNLPDKVQKNLNREDVRFWYLEIFFSKYTCWWWCVGVVQSFLTQCCAFIKDTAVSCAVNVRVLAMPREFTWEKILSMDIALGKSVHICCWPNEH